ncbi:uncharacterized protein LOC110887742 [Helianthus annuus]|uniref:uncharacterized protein LOC110887742 n=1 Tax=Helianthus annuus TaxID=4232 RepID=UPI001653339B|nr:uncharacterized protein LOC110887742 [Helianthus annuus]
MENQLKGRQNKRRRAAVSSEQSISFPLPQSDNSDSSQNLSARRRAILAKNARTEVSHVQTSSSSTSRQPHLSEGSSISPMYLDIGNCSEVCEYCNARFWYDERLKASPLSRRPRYNQCCKGGRVKLQHPREPPDNIKHLFERHDFLDNIRAYNSMFAMTSFGATTDDSINLTSGPYVFKVSGQICHRIGSICPPSGERPRFLQMYIYDTENELSNRLHVFGEHGASSLDADIVALLLQTLDSTNKVVRLFRTARDLSLSADVPDFAIRLYSNVNEKSYDTPSIGSIGAIVYEDQVRASNFDIIIRPKDDVPQRVSKLHSLYMALQYPLLFVFGEQGWTPELRLADDASSRPKQLTMNMFYSYHLHDRFSLYTHLLRGGRLFQQYLVDAYICIEQNRLEYIQSHQDLFRTEYLQGIHDALIRGDTNCHDIGKRTVLPSSFTGGPRYMYKHYQDALAICRVHGNPQYFITFTCNVKWPELKRYLAETPHVKVQDRPDIIARIFRVKVDAFMGYLRSGAPFGEVVAEFQKRGLPHCHTLLWVKPCNKIQSPDDIDSYISAEIPNPTVEPVLHKIVTELMLHGPCGLPKPNAPCMIDGTCSKNFPKNYESATRFDKEGYAHYKRKADGFFVIKNGVTLDNSFVVPYNKDLLLRFDAHINVEYCGWNMVIKYLFKYISKGADRIRFTVTKTSNVPDAPNHTSSSSFDEIKNFVDGRFICPHEAAWRIFDFPIHSRNPAVQVLAVHLENMQNISFRDSQQLQNVVDNPIAKKTTLTEWLHNNILDDKGRHLRYVDYVSEYRWDTSGRCWIRRATNRTPAIGRLIYVHPSCGETFYLRMLLGHQTGCRNFSDIRTVGTEIFPTYRNACEKLGLLDNDDEWTYAFTEASVWATSKELRSLFTHMLLFCEISNPLSLWRDHWRAMSDDVVLNIERDTGFKPTNISDEDLQQHVLFEIELLLNSSASSSSLCNFGLPMPRSEFASILKNRLVMEEKNYDIQKMSFDHELLKNALHPQQFAIYDLVVKSIAQERQILLFVYGHGGTGKTYLWTTIICALRASSKIVLAVAASGIASLLLPSGRTAHSRFKIPLELTDDSLCDVKKNTQLAQLLKETSLIIWDEAPMSDRRCFESLDKTLRDILDNSCDPFGGKSVLLGGDFRQTLPVKPKATKSAIINSSLPKSYLWGCFKVMKLTENMRLHRPNLSSKDKADIAWFSSWLLDVGDGKIGEPIVENDSDSKNIDIPSEFLVPFDDNSLSELIRFIYDEDTLRNPTIAKFSDKAIVCPKNKTADEINNLVLSMCEDSTVTYLSSDSMIPHANDRGDTEMLYPVEYLNVLSFSGLPPHRLDLKVNTPIILLRNINQTSGLCNGTRLLISRLLPKIIEAQVITGIAIGNC